MLQLPRNIAELEAQLEEAEARLAMSEGESQSVVAEFEDVNAKVASERPCTDRSRPGSKAPNGVCPCIRFCARGRSWPSWRTLSTTARTATTSTSCVAPAGAAHLPWPF